MRMPVRNTLDLCIAGTATLLGIVLDVSLCSIFKAHLLALADDSHEGVKLRREDVFINLVEVPKENWSHGNGEAQYVK